MQNPELLIAEAQKKEKPTSGFFSFLGGGNSYRFEEASDLYVQAANVYRLQKNFTQAGKTFERAAEVQEKLESSNDVSNYLVDAYKCYKSSSPGDAIRVLERAIHIFLTSNGQFRRAANFQMDLGELYESVDDVNGALDAYEKAGDYFSTDQAEALSNKAYLKVADLGAETGKYKEAVAHYTTVIKQSVNNNLTKWSLKDYFFKVILCHLASGDVVAGKIKSDEFIAMDSSFANTREYKLAQDVIEAVEEGDPQAFSDKVFEYDQFSKLDKLKTTLLLKIKTNIMEEEEDDFL